MAIVSHYLEHQQLRKANRYSAMAIFNILDQHLEIESVLDLGCGTGVWMQAALCKPGRTVLGVDLKEFAPAELLVSEDTIINATLSQSINLHRRFDLVLCLETAEHIPGECAHHIVANRASSSGCGRFSWIAGSSPERRV
jgi:2-polyprenyl-3-methyl-5-hydroxy-6-metoxy-1,4-benzoquinol methylase